MNLLHLSTVKYPDGFSEVTVRVLNKKTKNYTFYIASDYAIRQFQKEYDRGNWGKAFNILKTFNRKGEANGEG